MSDQEQHFIMKKKIKLQMAYLTEVSAHEHIG